MFLGNEGMCRTCDGTRGVEADAIVIIEMPGRDKGRERVNRYVARSRAKHLLIVIEAREFSGTVP